MVSRIYFWPKCIRAPALQELFLAFMDDILGKLSEIIMSLIHRSNCKLMRLTLAELAYGHTEILQHTPEVVHLSLSEAPEKTIGVLTSLSHGTILTGLQSLEVGLRSSYDGTPEIFERLSSLALIRNGQCASEGKDDRAVGRLHSLGIVVRSAKSLPPQWEKLRALCEELGIQLRFHSV